MISLASAMSATVTLDRQGVVDLLTEAYAVCDVLEDIAGVCPTALTEELGRKLEAVAIATLGPLEDGPGGVMVGPVVDLWD
jgi:hypothetical protein